MSGKKIIVLSGGTSAEREVSLKSGSQIHSALIELGHQVELEDLLVINQINHLKKNVEVFIALHGFEGESGILQDKLTNLGIDYFGSNVQGCINTWNKANCKKILIENGINTPKFLTTKNIKAMEFPSDIFLKNGFYIKPSEEGSSIDTFAVKSNEEFKSLKQNLVNPEREFLIEETINGREFTVSVLKGRCLAPLEIIPASGMYDYHAKYIAEDTIIQKAQLETDQIKLLCDIALKACTVCECKDWARVDVMQNEDGEFYVLEINTVPGMTDHSLFPAAAKISGLSFNELIHEIISDA